VAFSRDVRGRRLAPEVGEAGGEVVAEVEGGQEEQLLGILLLVLRGR